MSCTLLQTHIFLTDVNSISPDNTERLAGGISFTECLQYVSLVIAYVFEGFSAHHSARLVLYSLQLGPKV